MKWLQILWTEGILSQIKPGGLKGESSDHLRMFDCSSKAWATALGGGE